MSAVTSLTSRRKADRAVMAAAVVDLARAYGITAGEPHQGILGPRDLAVDLEGPHGLKLTVHFDGTPGTDPDTYVLNWCGVRGARLEPDAFGHVNPYHGCKATDVAEGWESLRDTLQDRFRSVRDGSAFVTDKDIPAHGHFDSAEGLALYRTLPEAEIRRRQDICHQQIARAHEARNTRALADLQAMDDALTAVMLERC